MNHLWMPIHFTTVPLVPQTFVSFVIVHLNFSRLIVLRIILSHSVTRSHFNFSFRQTKSQGKSAAMFNSKWTILCLWFLVVTSAGCQIEQEVFIDHGEDHAESGKESSGNSSLSDENEEVAYTTESLATTIEDETETDLKALYTLEEIEAECESEKNEGSFEVITTAFEEDSASGTVKESNCDDEDLC
jgi:hypothetical protein